MPVENRPLWPLDLNVQRGADGMDPALAAEWNLGRQLR